jgi:hypothetical protein
MSHDEIQDLLEAYIDETLDRRTRAEVDDHLRQCPECRAILDGVPPVQLGRLASTPFDERAMRRAVRTTLLRLAVNVVVAAVALWLVIALLGALVLQPLLVDRGGRAVAATVATRDLAVMYNPGASVDEIHYDSGVLSRTSDAHVVIPIGTEPVELGVLESRIGLFSFGASSGGSLFPFLSDSGGYGGADLLANVGSGTVATIELRFDPPLSVEQAQHLAETALDVRVVWAGFATTAGEPLGIGLDGNGVVGYGTCDERDVDQEFPAGSSGGASGTVFVMEPSIERALDATRSAIDNLLAHDELIAGIQPEVTRASIEAARSHLADDPGVVMLVVTGPTPELLSFVEEAAPSNVGVRDIDFTNWQRPICGR